jgi:hypothetical protein
MEISKTLRRPVNWQDFETLCKKLWGEICNCHEKKKKGRKGQFQCGVDVYGIPAGETEYYGIQCKGKDKYTDKQFKEEEITSEIEKAKSFIPKLKKLYFATTAVKDVKIEEFVRLKNLENINKGLFEIHIFSWEDIVELIDENKQTHDYYVNSQNYKSKQSVAVTFQNGNTELVVIPQFQKTITHFRQKAIPTSISCVTIGVSSLAFTQALSQKKLFEDIAIAHIVPPSIKINKSLCEIYFEIYNTGSVPLEEYKLLFRFEGNIQDLTDNNKVKTGYHLPEININHSDVRLKSRTVVPVNNILVGDDIYRSDSFYIKPLPDNYEIKVFWKLISKHFKDEGELTIIVKSNVKTDYEDILVEDPLKVRIVESAIKDMLVEENESAEK